MSENYYETLGVSRSATPDEIKKNYRKLARQYHPDLSKEADAETKMQAINVAYDTLSHPEKKAEYDQMLDNPHGFSGFNHGASGGFDGAEFHRQGGNSSNFQGFEDLFGRFGSGFGGANYQYQQQQRRGRGEDQHARLQVDLDVAYHGTEQVITLQIPTLNAYGEPEVQRKTLQVKIPKGMKEGQQIRLTGQGQAGINGGENGDLYIEIRYISTDRLRVEDRDIYFTVNIAPWEASLGQTIDVNTPAGKLSVNLPKNAKTGQQLRLKDKGIPSSSPGHLYLLLNIVLPEANNAEQQRAYEEFAHAFSSFKPRS